MADITKYYSLTDDLKQYGQVNGESNPNATTMQDMQAYMQQNGDTLDNVVKAFLWQPETDYIVNQEVHSPNLPAGYMAICSVAGKTGTTEPSWSTTYTTFKDGTVTWKIENLSSGKVSVSTYNTDMALKAPLASPALTGSATLNGKNIVATDVDVNAIQVGTSGMYYDRYNGFVTVRFAGLLNYPLNNNQYTNQFTLPQGFRPYSTVRNVIASGGNATELSFANISVEGVVSVWVSGSGIAISSAYGSITFKAAEV